MPTKPPPWVPPYEYRAEIVAVHDGDTITARVDFGGGLDPKITMRLLGINAPELKTGLPGKDATNHLKGLLSRYRLSGTDDSPVVMIRTVKDRTEKYGRLLADVFGADGDELLSINQRMVTDGFAVQYMV